MNPNPAHLRDTACMGGFCAKRDHCSHYHAEDRRNPAERLCPPGADGVGIERPIVFVTPVDVVETPMEAA